MDNFFHLLSAFFILSGFACFLLILLDIFPNRRQPMRIMEVVWPLTGLWASWVGLLVYRKLGRSAKMNHRTMPHEAIKHQATLSEQPDHKDMLMDHRAMDMSSASMPMSTGPRWQSIILSTLHCGAGCTLADLIGETFTAFVPIAIGSSLLAGQWVLDYILALVLGIYFQYAAIRPMEPQLSRLQTVGKAFKIDFFSLTAWQAGMYGWMAIVMFVLFPRRPMMHNSWEFWFMMQIAMFFGFLASYPANRILIRMGIKKGM